MKMKESQLGQCPAVYPINRGQTKHSARDRTFEHMKRKSRVEVVEGTAYFRHACDARMRRHKNAVVHSDFRPTKKLLAVA